MPRPVEMDTDTSPRGATAALKPSPTPNKDRQTKEKVQRLQGVFEQNFRSITAPVKHNRVSVLLLSWDQKESDIHVLPELEELASVFKNDYQFNNIRQERLKEGKKVELQLQGILIKFLIENDDPNNLCIVYYAGHGFSGRNEGELNITSNSSQQSRQDDQVELNTVAWHVAESTLRGREADIFVIFDCCEAGALRPHSRSSHSPSFEFLGACDRDQYTPGPGEHSFTHALIWALRKLKNSSPKGFDSVELRRKIISAPNADNRRFVPVLFSREPTSFDHIWIYPKSLDEVEPAQDSSRVFRKDRPPMDSLVMRFRFSKHQEEDQVKKLAESLSQFVKEQRNCLGVHHVELTEYISGFKDAVQTIMQRKRNDLDDLKVMLAAKSAEDDEGKEMGKIIDDAPLSEEQKSFFRSLVENVQVQSRQLTLKKVAVVVVSFLAGVFSTLFFGHQFFFLPHARILQAWGYWGVSPDQRPMLGGAGTCC